MSTGRAEPPSLRFGLFELNPKTGELRKAGVHIKLQPQPFKVLTLLASRAGQLVTREEIRQAIWGADTFVDFEQGLNFCVKQIRMVLGDDAESPRYIETLARRGYRFIAPVEELSQVSSGVSASPLHAAPNSPVFAERAGVQSGPAQARARPHGRWWIFLLALAATLLLLAYFMRQRVLLQAKPHAGKAMLVVLPFQNLSGDTQQEYLSDGLTEEMITQLGRFQPQRLGVISRTSAMHYKHTDKSARQIGQELGVAYVLEGSVRRSGNRVRISAQLIQVRDQTHLWAESYERDLRDVLALENDVARAIAQEIEVKLSPEEHARLMSTRLIAPDTYEAYLKGRYYWNRRDAEGFRSAVDYFQRAIEKDPTYAPAYAGLADTYSLLGAAGYDVVPIPEAMEKARAAALKALELDETLAEAHASLAFVRYSYDWDWAAAETEFKRAIALNPGYATAHQWYSEYLSDMGRSEEAVAEAMAALALDPLSLIINENVARPHYFARRFDQAIERSKKTLQMDPNFPISHLRLGRAYAAKGMYPEAITEFQKFSSLSGDTALAMASIGNALARSGDRSGALRVLDQLRATSKKKRVPPLYLALVCTGLGDKDRALAWLEKAFEERSDFLAVLRVDALFDPLRSDPRFQDLLRRIGLPP